MAEGLGGVAGGGRGLGGAGVLGEGDVEGLEGLELFWVEAGGGGGAGGG